MRNHDNTRTMSTKRGQWQNCQEYHIQTKAVVRRGPWSWLKKTFNTNSSRKSQLSRSMRVNQHAERRVPFWLRPCLSLLTAQGLWRLSAQQICIHVTRFVVLIKGSFYLIAFKKVIPMKINNTLKCLFFFTQCVGQQRSFKGKLWKGFWV